MPDFRLLGEWSYGGCGAVLTWPSRDWPHLIDYLEVEVSNHGTCWFVKLWLDFRHGLTWSRSGTYKTRDEAAQEAADLWAEGVRVVHAYWRGEPVDPPSVAMGATWEATEEGQRLSAAVDAVLASRPQWRGEYPDDYRQQWAAHLSGKDQTARAYDDARRTWLRAQDWRGFRDGVEPAANKPSVVVQEYRQMVLGEVG